MHRSERSEPDYFASQALLLWLRFKALSGDLVEHKVQSTLVSMLCSTVGIVGGLHWFNGGTDVGRNQVGWQSTLLTRSIGGLGALAFAIAWLTCLVGFADALQNRTPRP